MENWSIEDVADWIIMILIKKYPNLEEKTVDSIIEFLFKFDVTGKSLLNTDLLELKIDRKYKKIIYEEVEICKYKNQKIKNLVNINKKK